MWEPVLKLSRKGKRSPPSLLPVSKILQGLKSVGGPLHWEREHGSSAEFLHGVKQTELELFCSMRQRKSNKQADHLIGRCHRKKRYQRGTLCFVPGCLKRSRVTVLLWCRCCPPHRLFNSCSLMQPKNQSLGKCGVSSEQRKKPSLRPGSTANSNRTWWDPESHGEGGLSSVHTNYTPERRLSTHPRDSTGPFSSQSRCERPAQWLPHNTVL